MLYIWNNTGKQKVATHREKMIFYFKAFFCIFLIALWSFWFSYSSKEHSYHINKKSKKSIQIKEVVHQNTAIKTTEKKKSLSNSKITDSAISKEKKNLQIKLVKELPELATLIPVKTNIEKNTLKSKEEISMPEFDLKPKEIKAETKTSKEMINLNLPNIASATRKALIIQETLPAEHNPPLRKGIKIQKDKLKLVSITLNEDRNNGLVQKINLGESWLPKYIEETKEPETKSKNEVDSLDKIAEQIELSGIVNKPNGESTVIIRNKLNNYIEVLKKGDEYKGLKLLEINKNEVVLGNEGLNKTYIKRINTGG